MLAAEGRAAALEEARHAAAEEQAREQFGRFMSGRSYSPSTEMFHDWVDRLRWLRRSPPG